MDQKVIDVLLISFINITLISLKARLEKAKSFILNPEMYIESELLKAQIEALEAAKK